MGPADAIIRKYYQEQDYSYPSSQVELQELSNSGSDKDTFFKFRVFPFRYDAKQERLYFCPRIKVHVTYQRPADGIASPTSPDSHPSSLTPWYTLSGRRITTTPTRPGLYIKDGRKVLIK